MKKTSQISILLILFTLLAGCQPAAPPDPALPGPFQVGNIRNITGTDPSRQDREVSFTLWYPAIIPKGTTITM
jgi:hypothetical protein